MPKIKRDMRLQAERSLIIKELRMVDDLVVLKKVRAYLHKKMKPQEEEIDIDQYNREIDEAMRQMDAGIGTSLFSSSQKILIFALPFFKLC
jgi:hypothetical protein